MENLSFFQGFLRMCDDGWQMGWHERNGGNLSYRLTAEERQQVQPWAAPGPWQELDGAVPSLAGEYFLVTGAGKFFRNMSLDPAHNLGLLEIDQSGTHYRVLWGLVDARPTSELPSHLMNHAVKKQATDGQCRVIYHAHPANIVALTYVLPLDSVTFTRALWEMETECPLVFPQGVGVVPWMVPGKRDIALASSRLMETFDVIVWAHHGLFCAGPDFDTTFGLMHTVEKAAEIAVKVRSMAPAPRQTITPENFRQLAAEFDLNLPAIYL
jgi:rhamnulose-1-phosphate aldolase